MYHMNYYILKYGVFGLFHTPISLKYIYLQNEYLAWKMFVALM